MDELQVDRTLEGPVRKLALQIADCHVWEDAGKLENEAWGIIRSPGKGVDAYRAALARVEKADGWKPNDPDILRVLGAAQYQTGSYEKAVKTLREVVQLRANAGDEPDPRALAFTVMALQRLGRADEAKSTLEQLRALHEGKRFAEMEEEAKALLAEAEGLIEGKKP